ncbi:MAG: prepilin-type N-terminal cleavage/methylation domain-containing protein [Deltaproteobacteria bacterium]|nr:prepilin-type N-terminal cleavage/methylation domain-containing protein [Deltaproteobacteria bacterium]
MRRNSGFTVYELVVTIAVVAVLAAIATPSFLSWLPAHRLRGASINLMADMEMAKVRAIRENAFVAVQFGVDNYRIFVDDGSGGGVAGDWIQNGSERLVMNRALPAGVTIPFAELTLVNQRVRFSSRGLPADPLNANPELIPLVNQTGRRDIGLNRLGRLWVQ